jgi:hypothetical protein
VADGELEPHLRSLLVVYPPPSGERVDEMQSEPALPGIAATPADRTVTSVLDLHAHDAVHGGRPDLQWRAGGLAGVLDAVGDQLGDEQAGVLAQLGVPLAVEPMRDERASDERRGRAAGDRRLADLDQVPVWIRSHCILLWNSRTTQSGKERSGGHSGDVEEQVRRFSAVAKLYEPRQN